MEPSEVKNTKYVRVRWDGWNFVAYMINNETEFSEALKDDSIREGDVIFEVKGISIAKGKKEIVLEAVK